MNNSENEKKVQEQIDKIAQEAEKGAAVYKNIEKDYPDKPDPAYDEAVDTAALKEKEIQEGIDMYAKEGAAGAKVFEEISEDYPQTPDPAYDEKVDE